HSPIPACDGSRPSRLAPEPVTTTAEMAFSLESPVVPNYCSEPVFGESSNGRTQDSGSCYLGSNPCSPASVAVTRPATLQARSPFGGLVVGSSVGRTNGACW